MTSPQFNGHIPFTGTTRNGETVTVEPHTPIDPDAVGGVGGWEVLVDGSRVGVFETLDDANTDANLY